ncbi:hypothetical protein CAK78_05965 [Aeromonas sp. A35_P]|uniref:hypothetical protein n=1 Tax=Aeromonas sp. A35_P TaxID=1983805 RepID=UPI000B9ACAF7|nr:hypothetical protein [Aeromonas sp. A35_P]OZG42787.1 hypothetical protein CAK78_05965 [Aeromonas sp. A35_P]
MSVVSIRVSEQQKGEIERAALAENLSIPDYIRQTLAVNQKENLNSQMTDLKSKGAEIATEVQKLRDEVAALSEQAGKTAADLRSNLRDAQAASNQIKRHLDSDRGFALGIAGVVGWALALSGALLGAYLMH